MNLGITGKRALITGAGRGLGRSIAACLAREGAKVCVVSRTLDELESFRVQHGSEHVALACDLQQIEAPCQLVKAMQQAFGYPDIIVHNAGGTLDITNPFCSMDEWRRVFWLNLEVAVELNLMLLPKLQQQKWGRIVHVSSIASLENQGTVPYCSAKAALNAYVRSMGRFVSPHNICMSALLPGAVFTEGGYWDLTQKNRPEHFEKYRRERMAIQRYGRPDEIGDVVAFLCSEQASFIVGSSFLVDGGQGRAFQNNDN